MPTEEQTVRARSMCVRCVIYTAGRSKNNRSFAVDCRDSRAKSQDTAASEERTLPKRTQVQTQPKSKQLPNTQNIAGLCHHHHHHEGQHATGGMYVHHQSIDNQNTEIRMWCWQCNAMPPQASQRVDLARQLSRSTKSLTRGVQ